MNAKGFTLLEGLISLGLLGVVLVSLIPTFQHFLNANTLSEERSNAVAAAQQVIEALRHEDPASLPKTGSSPIQAVTVGAHEYEVVTTYCQKPAFCGTDIRHIVVEVSFGTKVVYTIETVFTRLR